LQEGILSKVFDAQRRTVHVRETTFSIVTEVIKEAFIVPKVIGKEIIIIFIAFALLGFLLGLTPMLGLVRLLELCLLRILVVLQRLVKLF
jgi:hypothetical protein